MVDAARTLTVGALAEIVAGEVQGSADLPIAGIEAVEFAGPGEVTFVSHARYVARWVSSSATAAIVTRGIKLPPAGNGRAAIIVDDAELAVARALEWFAPPAVRPPSGVSRDADVDPSARVAEDACVAGGCSVGAEVTIGAGAVLFPGVRIYEQCRIGAGTVIHANCVLRERTIVGDRVVLHPGVVLGADGFGYRPASDGSGLVKMPHIGHVRLGDDVEVGAGTAIDRAKFGETVIGAGTKIDNLVQVGHNVRIGRSCVIVGLVGIGGSAVIGDGVTIAGGAMIHERTRIGDGAKIGACSGVMHDVPAGEAWLGAPAVPRRDALRQMAAIRRLSQCASDSHGGSAPGSKPGPMPGPEPGSKPGASG